MNIQYIIKGLGIGVLVITINACVPELTNREANRTLPGKYPIDVADSVNSAKANWREYFHDPNLIALIDTALHNNQELNIVLQEMEVARSEVRERKGEYLPSVGIGAEAGLDKVGRYTRNGALEANNEIRPGKEFPEPFTELEAGLYASWEVDIWRKLRNAKKAAFTRYLATIEGRNFMVTNLIAEIATAYYELLALKSQLAIVQQNIKIQSDVLEIVKLQKQSARVTELAVKRFEAQVLATRSLQYALQQEIVETENEINYLVGRYSGTIPGDPNAFEDIILDSIRLGIPSQLLENRPDIRQAEFELAAANLDINIARADFYPSLGLKAGIGFQSFTPAYLVKTPQSLMYGLVGELSAPLVNRNAIKSRYYIANAKQAQAVYHYEQTVLKAYMEVVNQLASISNLANSYYLKLQQVDALTEAVEISNILFKSARADYMEVLLTQREALESKFELIETKKEQLDAKVNIYRALGGGWN
ncbi:RND efflux system, outer membrane lipoprotein, NodT family [Fulvivirga imtechensis AK7]|uniref:RND efflux system, outer membrane lipoprotein, NodT family n=1 Tax=Fulvivirga imtechensis AK7 TaxID=1237149 RepID=L8JXX6_9BACT|nr:TolC family protein [Fulvivirga imtechensis]ELR73028.1 RND efflux system, outer membrane lipoprotein, NodT family [Fulvivirga imtechensis AK7]